MSEAQERKEVLNTLLESIKLTEIDDENILDQKEAIARRLGVSSDDIEVQLDITATQLAREGILFDLHIGRTRFEIGLSPKDLGVAGEGDSSDYKEFLAEYINLGRKRLIPASIINQLNRLESRARNILKDKYSFKTAWGYFIPYKLYDNFVKELDEIEAEYRQVHDEIIERYDSIRWSTYRKYQEAAPEVYRRLKKDPYVEVPDEFVETFTEHVMKRFPTKEQIRNSYLFQREISFVPLTNTLRELEAHIESNKIKLEAQKEVAKEARKTYKKQIGDFISDLAAQLRSMIYEAVSKASESVVNNGSLKPANVTSLRRLIEKIERLNFMDDQQVIKQLDELNKIVDQDSEDRDMSEVSGILSKIAGENRQILLALGHEPRLTRGRSKIVDTKDQELQGPVNRRNRRGKEKVIEVEKKTPAANISRRQKRNEVSLFANIG
jgi:Mg2+ and Co2+ transporter CorA